MTSGSNYPFEDLGLAPEELRALNELCSVKHGSEEHLAVAFPVSWSFIIRNSYRPAMFRHQFEYIVGNPPWLSYRYIADPEYQEEIKRRAVERYKIAPKSQKLFTQMELATVFLAIRGLRLPGKVHGSRLSCREACSAPISMPI